MVVTKKTKHVSYITSATVTKNLQVADKAAHGIKISKKVRWKSDTCMDYLRNVTRLATNHDDIITKAIAASITS